MEVRKGVEGREDAKKCCPGGLLLLATKVVEFAVLFMWGAVEAENGRLGGRLLGLERPRLAWLVLFPPALVLVGMGMLDGRSDL